MIILLVMLLFTSASIANTSHARENNLEYTKRAMKSNQVWFYVTIDK